MGLALRGVASAAIDLSAGLAGDLAHVLRRSRVGATVELAALPCGAVLATQSEAIRRECTAAGGDDYELLFTAADEAAVRAAALAAGVGVTRIGHIDAGAGLRWVDAQGRDVAFQPQGFDHFAD